jgi:hypothetical protein
MGPAFYVMAILGCGEAETACEPVANVAAQYRSAEECNAATGAAIEKHLDALYPVVVAQCRKAADPSQRVFSDEIKLPAANQRPSRVLRASYTPQRSRS